jgi:hypothetical protein
VDGCTKRVVIGPTGKEGPLRHGERIIIIIIFLA